MQALRRPLAWVVAVNLALGVLAVSSATSRTGASWLTARRPPAAPGAAAGPWEGVGVVRAVLAELDVVVLTHDAIEGYMPAMTMGFRASRGALLDGLAAGDAVRFRLEGTAAAVMLTAVARTP